MPGSRFDSSSILYTKLYPPRARKGIVARPRLLEPLHDNLDQRLTLISAPAGYGKTTLMQGWIETTSFPSAWLSLDEQDDDLATFAAYLLASIRTAYVDAALVAPALLEASADIDAVSFADIVITDLEQLPGPLIVALDDYHVVQSAAIHTFMGRLLERSPDPVHFVVSTRADPAFPLAKMRGRGQITEIRGKHLRFTPEESAQFLQGFICDPLPDATIKLIADRTEGWPAGLQMAAISLRDSHEREDFARRFASGNNRLVTEYLLREVLNSLPDDLRSVVICTSILGRMCGSLCEQMICDLIRPGQGERYVQEIWAGNLFLTSLDDEGIWYRYHHLFRDMTLYQLHRSFSVEQIRDMHLRASEWFQANGLLDEAIIHAVRSGDHVRAAQLVEAHFTDVLDREEWRPIDRWLTLLPESVRRRPMLLVAEAYLRQITYRPIAPLLEDIEADLNIGVTEYDPEQTTFIQGSFSLLRATASARSHSESVAEIVALTRHAVDILAGQGGYVEGLAELSYIVSLQYSGRAEEGIEYAYRVLREHSGPPDARIIRAWLALCMVHYAEADLHALEPVARTFLQLAEESDHELSLGWCNYLLGYLHYQRDELEDALAYFGRAVSLRHTAHSLPSVNAHIGVVLVHQAKGQVHQATKALADLRNFILDRGMVALIPLADALEARLVNNKRKRLPRTNSANNVSAFASSPFWICSDLIWIAMTLDADLPQTQDGIEETLLRQRTAAEAKNVRTRLIEIGAVEALFYAARGQNQAALDALRAAVHMGEDGGALRIFVDVGPLLIPWFHALLNEGTAPSYVERILAAYGETTSPPETISQSPDPRAMFTYRELEVLSLLAARMTDKEIARTLHISPRTVQGHSRSIYEKLHVNSRRQAVAKARSLGINP